MNVRPITDADLPALAAIAAEDEAALGRRGQIAADDVRGWIALVDLANDSWLFEEGGAPAAAGWFQLMGELGFFVGIVAQGHKGEGLGTAIAERAESRAYARGARRLHGAGLAEDGAAAALFEGRGYHEVRRFYEMAIELVEPPQLLTLPDGLVLDEVAENEMRLFHDALAESFQDHWEFHASPFEEWVELRRGQHHDADGPLWFVIRDGVEVAAVARNEARSTGGLVGALGVRRPWRGRGLAKALLQRTFAEFHRRGLTRVTLGVDAESPTGATHLYERVGMHVESCNVVYEKLLA